MAICTIGIDIGSTSSKGVLYDVVTGAILSVESDSVRPIVSYLPAGHYEEEPEPPRVAAYGIIKRLASTARELGHSVSAICFTGQMHGGLLVDESLRPLTNFVTWQDKRGDEIHGGTSLAASINAQVSSDEREALGTDLHTGFLGVTFAWWRRNSMVPKNARLIGIYEWIASTLTGRLCSDRSSAAAWGLYNIRDHNVSATFLNACEIEPHQMPEVLDIGEVIGTVTLDVAHELGLDPSTKIIAGMGDTQASYIGARCTDRDVLLNFGTGSQLMIEANEFGRHWGTDTRYLSSNSYLIVAPTLAGGKAYSILADFFLQVMKEFGGIEIEKASVYARMNELAASEVVTPQFTPFFLGSRTHGEELRASISGLDADSFSPAALTRGLLEGMIAEVKEPYDRLPKGLQKQTGIVASGNGMRRNPALRDIASASFGLPLRKPDHEEEAALGAAIVAARAIK